MDGFKPIPNFESYSISKDGKIWSSITNKILKSNINSRGYMVVSLVNSDGHSKQNVHRLIAIVHIPNPDKLPFVNHIDGDKTHNTIENLEWCTNKYNLNHASSLGLFSGRSGVNHFNSKLDGRKVREIRVKSSLGRTLRSLASEYGVASPTIHNIIKGRTWRNVT